MMSRKEKKKRASEFVKTHRTHVKCRCGKREKEEEGGRQKVEKRTRKREIRCEGGYRQQKEKEKKKQEEPHTLWPGGLVPVSFCFSFFFLLLARQWCRSTHV